MSATYQPKVDLKALIGIDVHVHPQGPMRDPATMNERQREMAAASQRYFRLDPNQKPATLDTTAEYYREQKLMCAMFGTDPQATNPNRRGVTNDEVLEAAARHPDVIIPFAGLDPHRGRAAADDATALIAKGVRGFKFHPPGQGFVPNEKQFYDLWGAIEAGRGPALFHTGQSGMGAGARGGGGMRIKFGNPLPLDDLAVDFPDLPIVMAHPSWPWQEEALAIAAHKPLAFIDLSGWSPKYFPPQLIQYANTLIKDKVLFGTDYPLIKPERWIKDFNEAAFKDEVRPLIMKENAARLFGFS